MLFDDNKAYTVEDVAKILHLSKCTVYRLLQTKKIKAFRIGGRKLYRILGKDLNAFLSKKDS